MGAIANPPETSNIVPLPDNSYAVCVHRLFVDRVVEFLTTQRHISNEVSSSRSSPVLVLEAQVVSGASQARRGFVLLLIENTKQSVTKLSPFARQNMSWTSRITHRVALSEEQILGQLLWQHLQMADFDVSIDVLRVDTVPRDRQEGVCFLLEQACAKKLGIEVPTEPFQQGPLELTKSRSKCSHRLTIVFDKHQVYWGIDTRLHQKALLEVNLNHDATDELNIVPCDPETGRESENALVDATTPLSRAYYKLDEVLERYLKHRLSDLRIDQGTALDLGASPGGWTQVLAHVVQSPQIVAVDPGRIASRVSSLPHVTCLCTAMKNADLKPYGPYSLTVCDASMLGVCVFDELLVAAANAAWSLPSTWIITLKLPFKTLGSIQRHLDALNESLPRNVDDLGQILYPNRKVATDYHIVHLMANSDSERTLLLTFEKR